MQLDQFISESLNQIFRGISNAKKEAKELGFQVNPWIVVGRSDPSGLLIDRETKTPVQIVEFDVAVTTAESDQSKGGAGIFIASLAIGAQRQASETNMVVSRIKFSVPISLPRASDSTDN
jgi:hypothetical protein